MAYSRDFDGESTGSATNYAPGDKDAATTFDIDATVFFGGSGKSLKIANNASNVGHDWQYDTATNFSSGDFTATLVVRMSRINDAAACRGGLAFRVSSASNNCYVALLRPQAASATVRLSRLSGGTETAVATATLAASFIADTWYHIKVFTSGSTIKIRVWKDGDSEPGTWDIDTTDATYDNTRTQTGVYFFDGTTNSNIVYIDSIIEEAGATDPLVVSKLMLMGVGY